MATDPHPTVWLHHASQHLGVVPSLGGGVAAWQLDHPNRLRAGEPDRLNLWRPWAGVADCYTLACFPMVPWSNRISAGGFDHDGVHYPLEPNRAGEPYPIHGDGWLQPWRVSQPAPDTLEMRLDSNAFIGNPHCYHAVQRFVFCEGGMQQSLELVHTGPQALPYGIGLHPWFERTPKASLSACAQGVWLGGEDRLPTRHLTEFPPGWNPCDGIGLSGPLIDNAYTGWSGQARISWPEQQLELKLQVIDAENQALRNDYFLLYRPPDQAFFCLEPVTHPIDAFHLPDRPGLRVLRTGESLAMQVQWRFTLSC